MRTVRGIVQLLMRLRIISPYPITFKKADRVRDASWRPAMYDAPPRQKRNDYGPPNKQIPPARYAGRVAAARLRAGAGERPRAGRGLRLLERKHC
ncbi:hypothetical protein EVAR_62061_1 [Eumeta japonica]|uniref:Uncharacterized protein n=1 Tax=Eumeta variegata TaxID=151549 RepID=A0A4C1YVA0_EUMVA|nr:hypothetical protein EVAR_62061_1 [Eumeta japonica]